jgi:hypothetical protein
MTPRARANREAFFREPETRGVAMTETLDFTALDQFLDIKRLAADTAPASPLGSLVARPTVRSRNSVAFISLRSWRTGTKNADLAEFKRRKAHRAPCALAASSAQVSGPLAPPETNTSPGSRSATRRTTVARSERRRDPITATLI